MIDWSAISLKEFAGYVSEELRKRGIETVLVGGACVTIYSENRYQSYDLDYITYEKMQKVKKFCWICGLLRRMVISSTKVANGSLSLFHLQQLKARSISVSLAVLKHLMGQLNYSNP
jgi:hypothetical protein